ncbi:acylphosphatase, partial [Staphylococcus haemolyticus]
MKQKHLQVFGTVQGVGFRYYTQRLANKYHILGTVQNVDDYVEIYAIGNDDDLEQFI